MGTAVGVARPTGEVKIRVIRGGVASKGVRLREVIREGLPWFGLPREVNAWRLRNLPHLFRGLRRVALARAFRLPHFYGTVRLRVLRASGESVDLGLASLRVVTTAGVNYLVDAFQGATEPENFKYHGIGTGTNGEAVGDTALQTEITGSLNPDNTRATGSQIEGASANIYKTVGTLTVDGAVAVTEHGIFTQAATGGGTLLDRSVFSAVNLASGDAIETTYQLTLAAGG